MEIERQFLVEKLPPLPEKFAFLAQGYISLEPEIRIRQIGESQYFLTVKRGAGLVREEWETAISFQEFGNLKERLYPGTCMIRKKRYRLPLPDGLIAELHVHAGHLMGFNYVEVEFPDVESAQAFIPPSWFGREVTEDARFSYGLLAQENGLEILQQILQKEHINDQ
ncbi:MAG: CYTH domain-containing protein [Selenomonas sp.]|uniref:CYTH domain-containing protein n=1 Tax=Selenomonas sp. TaxID=2053611 RepID=UPI0025F5CE19|nr:CYTH domain-containing protein [Selenomonas sp.]MCR5757431.1 CYTH domain-containing protein [Selenomonas sp.]